MSDPVPEVPIERNPARPAWKDIQAALEFLDLPLLQRFAQCDDNWDTHHERLTESTNVLEQFARHKLARHREKQLREDRVDRGMLEHLCEQCNAEIPEDSDYCVGEDATICAACGAANLAQWNAEVADRTSRGMCAELCSHCFAEIVAGTQTVNEELEETLCAVCSAAKAFTIDASDPRHALPPQTDTTEPRP